MAKKKLEEPEKWITVNGQHLPVYAGGRIGAPGQKEPKKDTTSKNNGKSKSDNPDTPKTNREWFDHFKKTGEIDKDAEYHDFVSYAPITDKEAERIVKRGKQMELADEADAYDRAHSEGEYANTTDANSSASLERKRNSALEKISKIKDLDEWDRNDLEDLYKDNGGAWIHSDAMERAIEAPLSGKKTSTEKSLRRNFDNMMRAWEDAAYTTESKEAKAFLEKEMKDYRDRFESNMKQWSDNGKKTASMDLGNGLRLTSDISDPYKNYSEVERAKKVNREKQYADKKLNQYRKAAQEEKAKAQSIADAISAKTGIANTGSRNARYDTSRAITKQHHKDKNVSDVLEAAKWTGKDKPMFIDKMTHGYRIKTGMNEAEVKKFASKIKSKTGIDIVVRPSQWKGQGYNIVIPFYEKKKK